MRAACMTAFESTFGSVEASERAALAMPGARFGTQGMVGAATIVTPNDLAAHRQKSGRRERRIKAFEQNLDRRLAPQLGPCQTPRGRSRMSCWRRVRYRQAPARGGRNERQPVSDQILRSARPTDCGSPEGNTLMAPRMTLSGVPRRPYDGRLADQHRDELPAARQLRQSVWTWRRTSSRCTVSMKTARW